MLHIIKSMEDFQKGIKENKVAVIDCHAIWCRPCKMIAPFYKRYSEEIPHVAFFKLDVDEVPDVAAELGIRSMPTFLFFEEGKRCSEFVGANWRALEAHLKKYREAPKVKESKDGEKVAETPKVAEEPRAAAVEEKVVEEPKVVKEPQAAEAKAEPQVAEAETAETKAVETKVE